MKQQSYSIMAALSFCLVMLSGCGIVIHRELVDSDEIENIILFDPNDYQINVTYDPNEHDLCIKPQQLPGIEQDETVSIKYAPFVSQAVAHCRIGQKKYPVLFDTGNSTLACVTPVHINENRLPVFPFSSYPGMEKIHCGLAVIEELKVGEMRICQLPAMYHPQQTDYQLLGLNMATVGSDKEINIPLLTMLQFKYIAFDHKKKRMDFSLHDSFEANNSANWKSYPMQFKDLQMFIETTLEGVKVKLIIDTGAASDLLLTRASFERLCEQQPKLKKSWKLKTKGFAPYVGGYFPYHAYFVWGLTFDHYKHRLSTIVNVVEQGRLHDILADREFDGMIGFPFFDDTVMVLDFEHKSLWVKKLKWSRFEE